MMRCPMVVALVVSATLARPAAAGILFGRQAKVNPGERVPQLLATLRTEQDEHKREAAAKELREFDAAAYPDIVPGLIDALQHDGKAAVRLEAAQTLAHVRPVTQSAGWALEEAAAHDASIRVRLHARNLLLLYRISGYRSKGRMEEPPLAPPANPAVQAPAVAPAPQTASTHALLGRKSPTNSVPMETAPPPLAAPLLVPGGTPTLQTPPPLRDDQGPELIPPK